MIRNLLVAFSVIVSTFVFSGCETGRAGLSQPANAAEISAAKERRCPIAFSATHAERNSAAGIDIFVTWKNISDKEIKYVYIAAGLQNRVGDWVAGEITGDRNVTLKFTGPFKPGQNHWGGLSGHPVAIYNREATLVVLKSVKVEFMDGATTGTIDIADLPSCKGRIDEMFN